jgi:uncharacterized membrane protein
MSPDPATLLAIIAMAAATILTRLAGPMLIRVVPIGPVARQALDAIPPAVLMAVIAPTAFATGWAETIACALTALSARRLPLLASIAIGVAAVFVLRRVGF